MDYTWSYRRILELRKREREKWGIIVASELINGREKGVRARYSRERGTRRSSRDPTEPRDTSSCPRARDPGDLKTAHYFPLPAGLLPPCRRLSFFGMLQDAVVLQNQVQAWHEKERERLEINIISRACVQRARRGIGREDREFLRAAVHRQSCLPFGRSVFVASGMCL